MPLSAPYQALAQATQTVNYTTLKLIKKSRVQEEVNLDGKNS